MNGHPAAESRSGARQPPLRLMNRYRLVERLGGGSMGMVFRAHDETLDRDVAIKFLLPERVGDGEASARFLREARAVARLSSPYIMTLYDVGREGEWHYLLLEYIPGRDLHTIMVDRGGPLALPEALHAIRGALAALAMAHAHEIIHRDIKPENVMVAPDGLVKVTDFGLALPRGDVRLTQDDTLVGTVLYLAPEVVTGAPPGRRSDLYAVGAVLYELLTGRPPFIGESSVAVLSQILNAPVIPPRSIDPGIPAEVENVILTLLAKDPAGRYASAEEVLAALPGPAVTAEARSAEQGAPEPGPLSLLERIVRASSAAHPRPAILPNDEGSLELSERAERASSAQMQALLVYAAQEDTTAALEAERCRLAGLLHSNVVEPLNLLLSQANAYEQTLGANPTARMAVSVLSSLARQVLQQVRDLDANLHPVILETLGLEPALEALASQVMRVHGLQINLALERLRERLPAPIEMALFRTTQDALDRAVRQAHASQVAIHLAREANRLIFSLADNGIAAAGAAALRPARQRLEQLGGTVTTTANARGNLDLTVSFMLEEPVELTPREMEVIQLLAEGLSNREMAQLLTVSPRTVNFHLDNIYSKLGVSSRTEAAIYALRRGWARAG
jgi:serine/threonine protein kinase/DNA-binding NarL/FixJ family response regulator